MIIFAISLSKFKTLTVSVINLLNLQEQAVMPFIMTLFKMSESMRNEITEINTFIYFRT